MPHRPRAPAPPAAAGAPPPLGGGPAGLTAGLYAARGAMRTLLVERLVAGGQAATTEWVENYPGFPEGISGVELSQRMEEQAIRFGLKTSREEATALRVLDTEPRSFEVVTDQGVHRSFSVIIAMGADYARLGVPGEEEFRGRGVSYCATCDGPFFRDQEVLVVGGGDSAVEEGIYLTKYASKVTVVHRRDRLRASPVIQGRAYANPKMEFLWNSVVEAIEGDQGVERVRLRDLRTGRTWERQCSGVFMFVGTVPNTQFLRGLVEMDERGYIVTDEEMMTSVRGVFACGDARRKLLRQVVTACGEGATAAFAAQRYVEELRGTSYK
ncbi:MAG: thioredoxin-disulfide reductase [Thermodesulfobacteriota bacterium]